MQCVQMSMHWCPMRPTISRSCIWSTTTPTTRGTSKTDPCPARSTRVPCSLAWMKRPSISAKHRYNRSLRSSLTLWRARSLLPLPARDEPNGLPRAATATHVHDEYPYRVHVGRPVPGDNRLVGVKPDADDPGVSGPSSSRTSGPAGVRGGSHMHATHATLPGLWHPPGSPRFKRTA